MWAKRRQNGFTIVELLIVIVVIGILAAISIVAYSGIQLRARDSIRAQDLASIKTALLLYQTDNGGVKATTSYGGNGPAGWNISSSPTWLSFLGTGYGRVPVDPTNTGVTDPSGGGLTYFYYCYNAGSGYLPATANMRISYTAEVTGLNVGMSIPVESCL